MPSKAAASPAGTGAAAKPARKRRRRQASYEVSSSDSSSSGSGDEATAPVANGNSKDTDKGKAKATPAQAPATAPDEDEDMSSASDSSASSSSSSTSASSGDSDDSSADDDIEPTTVAPASGSKLDQSADSSADSDDSDETSDSSEDSDEDMAEAEASEEGDADEDEDEDEDEEAGPSRLPRTKPKRERPRYPTNSPTPPPVSELPPFTFGVTKLTKEAEERRAKFRSVYMGKMVEAFSADLEKMRAVSRVVSMLTGNALTSIRKTRISVLAGCSSSLRAWPPGQRFSAIRLDILRRVKIRWTRSGSYWGRWPRRRSQQTRRLRKASRSGDDLYELRHATCCYNKRRQSTHLTPERNETVLTSHVTLARWADRAQSRPVTDPQR